MSEHGPPPDTQGQVWVALTGVGPAVVGQTAISLESETLGFLAGVNPFGPADAIGAFGSSTAGPGVLGVSQDGVGVRGESQNSNGVLGLSHHPVAAAVSAVNDAGGIGLWAESSALSKQAGHFEGNVTINGNLTMGGGGDVILADCAEEFEMLSSSVAAQPGSVMVLDDSGAIHPCCTPYDRHAVGVVSGAGQYRPAIVLDRDSSATNRAAIALIGKVCCKVDASYSPIEVGDLLTTSPTTGHAMKANDQGRAFGATLGKALRPLSEGQGMIPILVALQ